MGNPAYGYWRDMESLEPSPRHQEQAQRRRRYGGFLAKPCLSRRSSRARCVIDLILQTMGDR
jgi:hypothetical protein